MTRTRASAALAIAAALTVVAGIGGVTSPAPAQAHPMVPLDGPSCSMFDTDSVINQTGLQVNVAWSAAPGTGTGSYSTRGYKMEGPARLNFIKDTNRLDMTIDFQIAAGPFGEHTPPTTGINHYTGTIDGNGSARGTLVDSKGVSDGWTIDRGFQCVAAPVVPPPAAVVVPPPAAPVVVRPPAPTATVNSDTDLYDKPSDQGGHIIGQLNKGQVVILDMNHNTKCSADHWCFLFDPNFGAAWGRDLTAN